MRFSDVVKNIEDQRAGTVEELAKGSADSYPDYLRRVGRIDAFDYCLAQLAEFAKSDQEESE